MKSSVDHAPGIEPAEQKQTGRNSMPTLFKVVSRACLGIAAIAIAATGAYAQGAGTTFFVTSTGIGNGGNLGGLAGADNYCQTLAQDAGAAAKTWHAYLSTQAATGQHAA